MAEVSDSSRVCMVPACDAPATRAFTVTMPRIDDPQPVKTCAEHEWPVAALFVEYGCSCSAFRSATLEASRG